MMNEPPTPRSGDPGNQAVTLDDIAARCGVGRTTVHRALHGAPEVREATAARIIAVAAEMGYDPALHDMARRMAKRRFGKTEPTGVIGLYFPMHLYGLRYFNRIFTGIMDAVAEAQYELLTIPERGKQEGLSPSLSRGNVDAVITLSYPAVFQATLQALRHSAGFGMRPVVSMPHPMPGCALACFDDRLGGILSAGHLLELGHRHLLHFQALFVEEYMLAALQRVDGYRQAYRARGLNPDHLLHAANVRQITAGDAIVEPLLRALDANPDITAIITPNDHCAIVAWRALTAAGWHIPEELSIIGYDDTDPFPDEAHHNLLTSVQLPLEELGREAVRLAIRLAREQLTAAQPVVLPVSLALRASTAPPGRRAERA